MPDNVKMKVLELLKEADAKKQAKATGFQALVDDIRIGEDEYDYQNPNDCSLKGPSSDPSPLKQKDQWINLLNELRKS